MAELSGIGGFPTRASTTKPGDCRGATGLSLRAWPGVSGVNNARLGALLGGVNEGVGVFLRR